jgi:hypothetical protein
LDAARLLNTNLRVMTFDSGNAKLEILAIPLPKDVRYELYEFFILSLAETAVVDERQNFDRPQTRAGPYKRSSPLDPAPKGKGRKLDNLVVKRQGPDGTWLSLQQVCRSVFGELTTLLNFRTTFQCRDMDQFSRLVRQTREDLRNSLRMVVLPRPTSRFQELRNYADEFKHIQRIEIRFSSTGAQSSEDAILNSKCSELAGISDQDFTKLCELELVQVREFVQLFAQRGTGYLHKATRSVTPSGKEFHVVVYRSITPQPEMFASEEETLGRWLAFSGPSWRN